MFTARSIPYARSGGGSFHPTGFRRDPFADDASLSRHNCRDGLRRLGSLLLVHDSEQTADCWRSSRADVDWFIGSFIGHLNTEGSLGSNNMEPERWTTLSTSQRTDSEQTRGIFGEANRETFGDFA